VRGKNGGFHLGKNASEINLLDVICYAEQELNIVKSFGNEKAQPLLNENSKFENIMDNTIDAFIDTIGNYSLQDIINFKSN